VKFRPRRSLFLSVGLALAFMAGSVVGCADPESGSTGTGGSSGTGGDGAGTGGAGTGTGGAGTGTGGAGTGTGGSTGTGGQVSGTGGKGTGGAGTGTGGTGTGTGGTAGKAGGTGGTGTGTGGAGTGAGGSAGKAGGTGGTPATGGTTGTGGTPATGGATGNSDPSGLPFPPGSSTVAQPTGTPGSITVLNWAGFKGAVSYTLDDDNDSQISNYPTLHALGIPFTFYMWANRTEASNSVWVTAVKNGDEIGNHTWSHQSVPPGGAQDITMATTFIMQHLSVTPYTMAAPNGAAVYTTLANGLFMTNRGVSDAIIMPNDNTDRFTLPCYIPPTGAPESDFDAEVNAAQSAGGWRIILVHGFTGDSSAYQPVNVSDYTNGIMHTISLGNMWVGRLVDVASYWLGQKAFSSATTTTSGSNKTWTWTLPSNFAPGKYLRITVPGGTVTQKGTALPWNSHGFYEISLDAGSVTVGP